MVCNGPVKEWSLEMLSKKKRVLIAETLLRTALKTMMSITKHLNLN